MWFTVIMLKHATYTSKTKLKYFLGWLMIPYKSFWWRKITLPSITGHTIVRSWQRSSHIPNLHDGMYKATTLVVKERCVTSQWRRRSSIWLWFWTYCAVNTFDTKSFIHVIIEIDHGRVGSNVISITWGISISTQAVITIWCSGMQGKCVILTELECFIKKTQQCEI